MAIKDLEVGTKKIVVVDKSGNLIEGFPIVLTGSNVTQADVVTPSDDVDLTHPSIAIYVGTTGDVRVTLVGGQTITLTKLAAGVWHPICATRVHATGTTAEDILYAW